VEGKNLCPHQSICII